MPRSPRDRGRPAAGRMSSSEVTAASSPWSFQGRNYELHPLTVNDFGVITETIRGQVMRRYRDLLEPGMDPSVAQTILDNGYRTSSRLDVLNIGKGTAAEQAELLSLIATPAVLTTILWASLRHSLPRLTRFEVADWFEPEDLPALEDAIVEIFRLAGITIETDKTPPAAAADPAADPSGDGQEGPADADGFRSGGAV